MNNFFNLKKEIGIITISIITIALINKSELISKLFNKIEKEQTIILEKNNTTRLNTPENVNKHD